MNFIYKDFKILSNAARSEWIYIRGFTIKILQNSVERCAFPPESLTDCLTFSLKVRTLNRRSNTYCYEVSTFHRVLCIKTNVHFNFCLQIYHFYNWDLCQNKTMSTEYFKTNIIWNNHKFSNDHYKTETSV